MANQENDKAIDNPILTAIKELGLTLEPVKDDHYGLYEAMTLDSLVEIINDNTEVSCNVDSVFDALTAGEIRTRGASIGHDAVLICGIDIKTPKDIKLCAGKLGVKQNQKQVFTDVAKYLRIMATMLDASNK